ncbi:PQQ-dependent sugar dehydrogenase [Desertivirga brevis]|uniref:PQQ-dependent sugar dehydrogenase n=1 Tax=Desertivirga brevis TaxID=2810310 RepID=UPI001A974539|nr:sorbosone dehydrogenase family protein [Pedobacter sp. SYSU D00873]
MNNKFVLPGLVLALGLAWTGCNSNNKQTKNSGADTISRTSTAAGELVLPEPDTTASKTNFSDIIGWPEGKTPVAPSGFQVTKYADGFQNPRWIYEAPNGDIFIAEAATEKKLKAKIKDNITGKAKANQQDASANRITILRDSNKDGKVDLKQVFLTGLEQPLGMLVLNNSFYVANTSGLMRFPYTPGTTKISAKGTKIVELPAGGYNNHWTRNIIASKDGSKIYISVGSGSNNGENGMEHEVRRAAILVVNPDGSGEKIYASGLRNPVGMDWEPGTQTLWTAVNERDELGDELVPDYITSVKENGFYGWPYAYFGPNEDPRMKNVRPDLVKKTIVPDVSLGSHTASLGLAFYDQKAFPGEYQGGAFIGQHGSWNHSQLVGYKVVFVPFKNGKPSGKPQDFLTGFIADKEKSKVYGRPVGVAVIRDGSLLVADDASNTIWRVAPAK